jgi:glutathione synthase/RimK-type ligase-like ATP-grasp enzyme
VLVADTYPAIGLGGVHLQPVEGVAAALEERGVLVIAEPDVARRVAEAAGGVSELWDNGSPLPRALAV